VESGKNEVAGFGGFERDFDGFAIAHFPDEDHLGSLAKRARSASAKVGVSL